MEQILMKAIAFFLIIVMGYVLKKLHFFSLKDFTFVSKVVLNITLPCAVITNFEGFTLQASLLLLIPLGIGCNLLMSMLGFLVNKKGSEKEKAFGIINYSGYNIGCFALPYVQGFLGPVGVVATCLFDAGNSILCTGGTFAIASSVAGVGEKTGPSSFFARLFSSIPVDTYLIMLVLTFCNIKVPAGVLTFTQTVGGANGFLAMLMVGIGFEIHFNKEQLINILKPLMVRYAASAVLALSFYYFLPFEEEIRRVMAIVIFAPISAVATAFTKKCGGDVELSSAINSFSIICSLIIMTILLLIM